MKTKQKFEWLFGLAALIITAGGFIRLLRSTPFQPDNSDDNFYEWALNCNG